MNCTDRSSAVIKRVELVAASEHPPLMYSIQFIDEYLFEEAIAFMIEHFVPNENMDKALGTSEDVETIRAYTYEWKSHLHTGISIAAFKEDNKGNRGRMIACYVLDIEKKGFKRDFSSKVHQNLPEKVTDLYRTLDDVMAKCDVFTSYACDKVIIGYGLTTAEEFQRRGIGCEMLQARADVSKRVGIPVNASVFDGEASQKLAERCGYETLAVLDLTTYRISGRIVYPHPSWPLIKWMAIRFS